jgi:hypothetical protein
MSEKIKTDECRVTESLNDEVTPQSQSDTNLTSFILRGDVSGRVRFLT